MDMLKKFDEKAVAAPTFGENKSPWAKHTFIIVKAAIVTADKLGKTVSSEEYKNNPFFALKLTDETGKEYKIDQLLFADKRSGEYKSPISGSWKTKEGLYMPSNEVHDIWKAIEAHPLNAEKLKTKYEWFASEKWEGMRFEFEVMTGNKDGKDWVIWNSDTQKFTQHLKVLGAGVEGGFDKIKGLKLNELREYDNGHYKEGDSHVETNEADVQKTLDSFEKSELGKSTKVNDDSLPF